MKRYTSSIIKLTVFIAAAVIVYVCTPHTREPVKITDVPAGKGFSVVEDKIPLYDGLGDDAKVVRYLAFGEKIFPKMQSELFYQLKLGKDEEGKPIFGYVKKRGILIYNPKKKHVALTFDDGPGQATTPIVLEALKKYNCRATFFVVGRMLDNRGMNLLRREVAQGCEIGNHSYSHPLFTDLKKRDVNKQLDRTDRLIYNAIGTTPKICRAPYGGFNKMVLNAMKRPNIYWSVDTLDWKTKSSKKTFKAVKKNVKDGAIVLMHDIHMPTAKAAGSICRFLKKDFETVTVTELASIQGRKLIGGRNYAYIEKENTKNAKYK